MVGPSKGRPPMSHRKTDLGILCRSKICQSSARLGPHTWRAYGPQGIRFTVTVTPSGFERFFQDIERRRLLASDVAELRAVADDVGMDILGPPLSDEEVRQIIAEAEVS
jgi:hypothetical protein